MPLLRQIVCAGRLDRSFYSSLVYDRAAAGNAAAVTALTSVAPALADRSLFWAAMLMLWSIVRAGLAAWMLRAAGVYLFRGFGETRAAFRLVGFAHITLLPLAARPWVEAGWLRFFLLAFSLLWFFSALRTAAAALFGMDQLRTSFLAAAGLFGWYAGSVLLSIPF